MKIEKSMKVIALSVIASVMFAGCGGGSSSDISNDPSNIGTTEFTTEMISGKSIYHWFDDNDDGIATRNEWLRATFGTNGELIFASNGTSDVVGSYIVEDGKIITSTSDDDETIILNSASATEWDVTFVEDKESKTWYLELKYTADMLVDKRFSVEFDEDDTPTIYEGTYDETTLKVYNSNGDLVDEGAYVIEDGVLIHDSNGERNKRYLIRVESDGSLLSWNEEEPEANLFTLIDTPSDANLVSITHNNITYGVVISPYTKRTWLDRNLNALRKCTKLDDVSCYGDYFQWGREADGHEKITSEVIDSKFDTIKPDSGLFPVNGDDWTNADYNGDLRSSNWTKTDGTSICPIGYRVPSKEELLLEISNITENESAFENFLLIPSSGMRTVNGGELVNVGGAGGLWTSTPVDHTSYLFIFYRSAGTAKITSDYRTDGFPVRCIKD